MFLNINVQRKSIQNMYWDHFLKCLKYYSNTLQDYLVISKTIYQYPKCSEQLPKMYTKRIIQVFFIVMGYLKINIMSHHKALYESIYSSLSLTGVYENSCVIKKMMILKI